MCPLIGWNSLLYERTENGLAFKFLLWNFDKFDEDLNSTTIDEPLKGGSGVGGGVGRKGFKGAM